MCRKSFAVINQNVSLRKEIIFKQKEWCYCVHRIISSFSLSSFIMMYNKSCIWQNRICFSIFNVRRALSFISFTKSNLKAVYCFRFSITLCYKWWIILIPKLRFNQNANKYLHNLVVIFDHYFSSVIYQNLKKQCISLLYSDRLRNFKLICICLGRNVFQKHRVFFFSFSLSIDISQQIWFQKKA